MYRAMWHGQVVAVKVTYRPLLCLCLCLGFILGGFSMHLLVFCALSPSLCLPYIVS